MLMLAVIAAGVALASEASAQRRGVRRPAPRPGVYVQARPYYYYRPTYYRPYYYSPALAFGGYAGWYSWYGGYPFYYAQYPYPYGRYRDYTSSARLQVEP